MCLEGRAIACISDITTNGLPPRVAPPYRDAVVTILAPGDVDKIVRALRAGEVVGIPTDTVYGLAAMPNDADAVSKLAGLKGRSDQQPIAVLFDDIESVAPYVEDTTALARMARFWPGALTAILRARDGLATAALTRLGTLGLRQPDDDLARSVIRACGGALAVSSANRTGEPPALSADEVAAAFGDAMLVLDGGPRPGGTASTVVNLAVDPPEALREGPIDAGEVLAAVSESRLSGR